MQGHGQESFRGVAGFPPSPVGDGLGHFVDGPGTARVLPMSRLVPLLAVLCFALGLESSGATVSSVPKPSRGSWVVDTTRTLDATTRAEVNQLGAEVHSSGQGQLVVVVVDTTQKVPARTFAQKLFNTWGIGKAGRDDGALFFIALKDRKAEILLGDGLKTPEDLSRSEALMSGRIVPAFKRGKPKEAVVEGAKGLRELLALSPLNARTSDVEAPPVQQAPQPTVAVQPQVVAQPQVRDEPVRDEPEQESGPGILTWVLLGAGVFGLGWVLRGWRGTRKVHRRGTHVEVGWSHAHGEHGDSHDHHDERYHDKGRASESEGAGAGVATAVAVGATAVAVASLVESSSGSDSSSSSWDSSSSSSDSSSSWDSSSSSSSSSDFGGGSSSGGGSSGEW